MKTHRIRIDIDCGMHAHTRPVFIQANSKKLQKAGNAIKYVNKKYPILDIKRISVRCWNENTNNYYWNVCFDKKLDYFRKNRSRVKVTYKWHESENMYVGRSTGWIPIYLVIKRTDSSGGGALLVNSIKEIHPLYN
jgi:hypothetical protein